MGKKDLQPKQKAPVVRSTTITLPQLSEEQLTPGIISGMQGLHTLGFSGTLWHYSCSFDGNDAE